MFPAPRIIEIIGLYFQYKFFNDGIMRFGFHSTLFHSEETGRFSGIMLDQNGLATIQELPDDPIRGRGFLKEYIGTNPRHRRPITYRFNTQGPNGLYWIGRFELEEGTNWGESHIVCRPCKTTAITEGEVRQRYTSDEASVWEEVTTAFKSLPPSFMHLSFLPHIHLFGEDVVIPELSTQDADIQTMCESMTSDTLSLPEAWTEMYMRIIGATRRMKYPSTDTFLEHARQMMEPDMRLQDAIATLYEDSLSH